MKQVKKLLVILPLVALFVLGSLPVLAAAPAGSVQLTIRYLQSDGTETREGSKIFTIPYVATAAPLGGINYDIAANQPVQRTDEIQKLARQLETFVMGQNRDLQDGYEPDHSTFVTAATTIYTADNNLDPIPCAASLVMPADNRQTVMAYNIHDGRPVFTQMHFVQMNPSFNSTHDIAFSYYNNSGLSANYIFAGYARLNADGTLTSDVVLAPARGEIVDTADIADSMRGTAEYAALVVPNFVGVEVRHTFPEGTRAELSENVDVPYATWATLQNSEGNLMDLPAIFRTRIQKVNEQGYTYRNIRYFNGVRPITGLLGSWNWARRPLGGDHNDPWIARVYYDVAVAAAKEVPTEKKVDAATAPQAQIQAPAAQAQAQAPVAAANVATTTAPVNTLPVTGASDSIFLFLSSAALMAVGILFFKKH